ncbi:MAG: hypothetical protein GY899_12755 [Verrucomicrobiaceae bacterium]|nr:hypothetical protein [Verrucomicrobiaceae bacterium]
MFPSHLLFQRISDDLVSAIVHYLRNEEREVYKSTLATLATERRLRPVFIQKRPLEAQLSWMKESLKLKSAESIADQVLQVWLLKSKKDMVIGFLEALGIEHDGDGSVEELPEEMDGEKLNVVVEKMIELNSADEVKLYLHMFQGQRPGGWEQLGKLLEEDERLKL